MKRSRIPLWYRLRMIRAWFFGLSEPGYCNETGESWNRVYKPRSLGYAVARTVHKIRHGI